MNDQPTPLEVFEAAFAKAARARAAAEKETRRIHDDGEPHHPDTCPHCQTDAIAKAFRDLANALADALTPMLDTLREAMDQKRPASGPTWPQQRAPRDHPTNTGLAARSRARQRGGRNALRRR